MARIPTLPSLAIIRGLKGILDFYLWRGLPCVRAWPKYRPAKQTAASLAAALLFGAIVKAYNLVGEDALSAYRELAVGIPRTARDIMVSGVYGNLHEASMGDFLDLLTQCRDFLSDLTALLDALHSVDTDELVVRVEHSVLPDDAATHTRQLTMLAALQKIDDLQDALQSKGLDRLQVRGEDQLFSLLGVLASYNSETISGANGHSDSEPVDADRWWIVTNIAARDTTNATTGRRHALRHGALERRVHAETAAFAAGVQSSWAGFLVLDPADVVRVYYPGGQVNDTCIVEMTGLIMTRET